MKKKYGIKKVDKYNWIIFTTHNIKDKKSKNHGKKIEKIEGYYPSLEIACKKMIDVYVGVKLINKNINHQEILKAIKKVKKMITNALK